MGDEKRPLFYSGHCFRSDAYSFLQKRTLRCRKALPLKIGNARIAIIQKSDPIARQR
ncbi:hypothetical protein PIB30_085760, partial [Stylosanthes scabra]|nr:hypothetical protein [Stylosanthes scabra]